MGEALLCCQGNIGQVVLVKQSELEQLIQKVDVQDLQTKKAANTIK
jgi:hypothetical protein